MKTAAMKIELSTEKNMMSANRRSQKMPPTEELTRFLQKNETFQCVLELAKKDMTSLTVRRYISVLFELI